MKQGKLLTYVIQKNHQMVNTKLAVEQGHKNNF